MKKLTLLALAAVSALLALPAFASANPPLHLNATSSFTVSGGKSELKRTSGTGTHGTSISGTGSFENTTTGTVELTFHGVTSDTAGGSCDSSGQPAGTVKTTKLPFHLVTLNDKVSKGILITSLNGHFATFNCGPFNIPVNVTGNGILGTITSPACGASSTTADLVFKSSSPGHQEHNNLTGTTYDLTSTILGSASTSSMDASAKITFPASRTLTCT